MGISLTGIHIYATEAPKVDGLSFSAFSPNWQTCVNDFSDHDFGYSCYKAKQISKQIDAAILYFGVLDSEKIWFEFFRKGKSVARYSDDFMPANKKIYDIPALVGYEDGTKRRLSNILACADVELKISMLEEYFGVCLLYTPELLNETDMLRRNRGDAIYLDYQSQEKKLTGKAAPITVKVVNEYPGKLFTNEFRKHETVKPHFYLHGFTADFDVGPSYRVLTPVQFTGAELMKSDFDTFESERIPYQPLDPRFILDYKTLCRVTFSDECPEEYRGRTMVLPNGYYPVEFLPTGELLLVGNRRIYVIDPAFKIIAKLSISENVTDVVGNFILTTTGGSFYAYCYEPNARIRIYEVVDHRTL